MMQTMTTELYLYEKFAISLINHVRSDPHRPRCFAFIQKASSLHLSV